jgi:energy-coupling factor transporter ATP-binding protein EcfA2
VRIQHIEIRHFRGIKSLSWRVKGSFNCIIGPGDSGKTTILTALDYALSPRTSLAIDDSDFFNQDVRENIVIQVTLADWDESRLEIKNFFQESKYAQHKCGLTDSGPCSEPQEGEPGAVSISLRVDESLEPKWSVVQGRDENADQDRKPIYASDRAVIGLSRVDLLSDVHFTWARNSILTRLSSHDPANLSTVLASLSREMRQFDISHHLSITKCQTVADNVKKDALSAGVKLDALAPRIDVQRQSSGAGAISLHEGNVPLRGKGLGSKKLISVAMQMNLNGGKNISLIDEIEVGLEPHRIRGLLHKLKETKQQIFASTHSPVVLRELDASDLYVCKREADGAVVVESLNTVSDIQGPLRRSAEAFLGSRIIACEGSTEVGCIRAYDIFRFKDNNPPVWSLATSYFDCGGAGNIKTICLKLIALGYETAVLCDNDAPQHLSDDQIAELRAAGAHICNWEKTNSTEHQLFVDMPWQHVPVLLKEISENHDTLKFSTMIDLIVKDRRLESQTLGNDPEKWPESGLLRRVIGDVAHKQSADGRQEKGWIRRIDYAEEAFRFALPLLPQDCTIKTRLSALWDWMQRA